MDESHCPTVAYPPVCSSLLDKLPSNSLSKVDVRQFASESPACINFTPLALQQRLAASRQTTGPNTPLSVIPPFQKPPIKPKPSKKAKRQRGGQPGHAGQTRSRRSEDIPEDLKPVVTEDVIHRDYCPNCKKRVEPKLPDVLPNCTLGNRTLVLTTLLHFLQGLSIGQIVDTLNCHLRMKVITGRFGRNVASFSRLAICLV